MSRNCPMCGKNKPLVRDDDLGEDGIFFSCHEPSGGCGATFRLTPTGECVDIF